MTFVPSFGAVLEGDGVRFRIWAPEARSVELVLAASMHPMMRGEDGTWTLRTREALPGSTYSYRIDGNGPFPDPASRFQPDGVHGPSMVVDPSPFHWTDDDWMSRPVPNDLVLYELHVGTFGDEGTYRGVESRLPLLRELGIDAVELMPVGDFPGRRNWGYDGVSIFAPCRAYGTPDDLRRLVDAAHRLGIAVFLDVVYNHFGPDGNYTGVYSPHFVTRKHNTPWGEAMNFDGPHADKVRAFFIENALHWIGEYHLDGLRLDATHAMHDDGPVHFLAELAERVRAAFPGRHVSLIAEDHRNLAHMARPRSADGWGLDGIWADDFHHQVRCFLTNDCEGYYQDYSGTTTDLAETIDRGWFFTGQHSEHLDGPRGSDPSGLDPRAFVICLQNHDQVGNRAFGERLHHQIDPAAWRAASLLLLCCPQTPLLFMGQEWACSSPFRYFTDHQPELGRLVTEGRRREFRHFAAFSDPQTRESIPDPQADATFETSRLDWTERDRPPHDGVWRLHQALLNLRRKEPALRHRKADSFRAEAIDEATLMLTRRAENGETLAVVCRLSGAGRVEAGCSGTSVLTTEDAPFCADPQPIVHEAGRVTFARPGGIVLRIGVTSPATASMPVPARPRGTERGESS